MSFHFDNSNKYQRIQCSLHYIQRIPRFWLHHFRITLTIQLRAHSQSHSPIVLTKFDALELRFLLHF
jgi:hypothetical protein